MKKIAFILALVMVFAVALVACDETPAESTPAESTPAESTPVESTPDEESVPAESTTPDESTPADESEEEPAGPEATENDPTLSFAGSNIALGLTVLNQDNIDSSITTMWIDTDLTDGVVEAAFVEADIKWTAGQWFGYYSWTSSNFTNSENGVAIPTVDLGASKTIYGARANVYGGPGWSGVCTPVSGELLVSDDGENWTSVGKVNVTAGAEHGVTWVAVAAPEGTTAQYVRLALQHSEAGAWMFIDELEIYGE
ncbi:MAG: discoidin domain-containing protein [Clostridia bacterium]|nr:discoidin domain-containing protein [Clostridia bacterium]